MQHVPVLHGIPAQRKYLECVIVHVLVVTQHAVYSMRRLRVCGCCWVCSGRALHDRPGTACIMGHGPSSMTCF